jgi:hypothetical protein
MRDATYFLLSNLSLMKAFFSVVPKRLKYKEVIRITGTSCITSVQSVLRETQAFANNTKFNGMRNIP